MLRADVVVSLFWRVLALPLLAWVLLGQQYPFVPVPNSPKNIERILQDKVGRLWMSTHDDVVCFDGARFFSLREYGLPADLAYGLTEDAEGGILIGLKTGIYRFFEGQLEHIVAGRDVHEIVPVAPGLLVAKVFLDNKSPFELYRIRAAKGSWRVEQLANIRTGSASGQELVLIDFSIAIVKEPDQTIHGLSRAAGTIYYMAPEQAVGFALPASDIYSLAKILLEMLTGQRLSTLLPNAALDLPDRVRELARGLPCRLSEHSVDLLAAALEFDPSRRPQDAQLFAGPIVRDLLAI